MALEELEYCMPDGQSVEGALEAAEVGRLIDGFLRQLPERERCVFLRRYWYVDSLQEIARRCRISEGTVKSMLFRTRKKLKTYLEKEGICV